MTTLRGNGRKYLTIDLSTGNYQVHLLPLEDYYRYAGGEGLALYLWSLYRTEEENPLVIAAGALAGSKAAESSYLAIASRDPLTHTVETYRGHSAFAQVLKTAGWDALVLLHAAKELSTLQITDTEAYLHSSVHLEHLDCLQTRKELALKLDQEALIISMAGENGIPFATISSQGIPLGRGGAGAALGSKRLKAVVVTAGTCRVLPLFEHTLTNSEKRLISSIMKSPFYNSQQTCGSLERINRANREGFVAVQNFSLRCDPRLPHLGIGYCQRELKIEHAPSREQTHFPQLVVRRSWDRALQLPGFEEAIALGSNIGNYDLNLAITWYNECLRYGLDALSVGNVIGWAQSAARHKLIDWADFLLTPDEAVISSLIAEIAEGRGVGKQLAQGVAALSVQYGLTEEAFQIGGKEMPPYDVRGAWGEALLLLQGESYPLIPEIVLPLLTGPSMHAKRHWVQYQRCLLAACATLGYREEVVVAALFANGRFSLMRSQVIAKLAMRLPCLGRFLVSPRPFAKIYTALTGKKISARAFLAMGREIVELKDELNESQRREAHWVLPHFSIVNPQSNHTKSAVCAYKERGVTRPVRV